jgi:hypothetical protein
VESGMTEETIVRENLMTRKDYSPYCGKDACSFKWPRTSFDNTKKQFVCGCGWASEFPEDFIKRYMEKWR